MNQPLTRRILLTVFTLTLAGTARAQAPDLSSLHDALHLTAAQESAWRTYSAAIRPDPSADSRHHAAEMLMSTLTTPRRVDLINAEMDEDMAAARRQGQSVKAFYATLTPDQQRTFDRQTAPSAGGGQSGPGGSTLRQPPSNQLRQPN